MAVEYISDETIEQSATNSGNFSINIPADCDFILVTVVGYDNNTSSQGPLFSELNFDNGSDFDFVHLVSGDYGSGYYTQVSTFYMLANSGDWPGTGTQTLYWASQGARNEGFQIHVSYWKNVDQSTPIIDTDSSQVTSSQWISSLSGVTANDMGIICVYRYYNTPDANTNGQTQIEQQGAFSDSGIAVAYKLGEGGLRNVAGSDCVLVAFALLAASGGGGTDINVTSGAITVASFNSTVSSSTAVSATLGTVAIAGYNIDLDINVDVEATLGTVTISGLNPTVLADTSFTSTLGTVTIAGLNATVSGDTTFSTTLGTITVSGFNPTVDDGIGSGTNIVSTLGTIVINSFNPEVLTATEFLSTAGTVVISGLNPDIVIDVDIDSTLGTITVSGLNANVSSNTEFTTILGTITVVGYNPTILSDTEFTTTSGSIVVSGLNSTIVAGVTIAATLDSIVISGLNPFIDTSVSLTLSDERTNIIFQESRSITISLEIRTMIVNAESRTITI